MSPNRCHCPNHTRRLHWLSDADLVTLSLAGSLEAYDELVGRYRNAVVLTLKQMVISAEVAQDLAQESFLIGFRALPQLRDPDRFSHWIYTIARNKARRWGRQQKDTVSDAEGPERPDTCPENCPMQTVLRAERHAEVQTALAGLPEEFRVTLSLFYAEGWTAVRIAEFLALPVTTIKWRLHAGKKRLRVLLDHLEEK